ncbi:hypothetical protein [Thermoactinomyces sp. DSM 45892]|uniref:hypothetical protein n=1 Tax=Thermoactinomyces sp. DSM 45892 TaxID=1882753 RepID=UPI00089B934A|nr:hypothetical protein [Thermoactinomyces sp. DSM 45892]SDY05170.1 hypothetical protein SAMN05444416_101340 [Thermoactinomyces sp. DSM 45892]
MFVRKLFVSLLLSLVTVLVICSDGYFPLDLFFFYVYPFYFIYALPVSLLADWIASKMGRYSRIVSYVLHAIGGVLSACIIGQWGFAITGLICSVAYAFVNYLASLDRFSSRMAKGTTILFAVSLAVFIVSYGVAMG